MLPRGAKLPVVFPGFLKTKVTVGTAMRIVCVAVVLPVILPEADGAYLISSPLGKGFIPATRTTNRKHSNTPSVV